MFSWQKWASIQFGHIMNIIKEDSKHQNKCKEVPFSTDYAVCKRKRKEERKKGLHYMVTLSDQLIGNGYKNTIFSSVVIILFLQLFSLK